MKWIKGVLSSIWRGLEHKGKIATALGTIMFCPVTFKILGLLQKGKPIDIMLFGGFYFVIGCLLVLPSSITMKFKDFTIEIKD